MFAQSKGQQALMLPVYAHQQGHEQPDPATVHVVEAAEVQDNGASTGGTGLRVGIHERLFGESRDVAGDVDDADFAAHLANTHRYVGLGHSMLLPKVSTASFPRSSCKAGLGVSAGSAMGA